VSIRPLDRLRSIKVKLGVVVLGSVAATTFTIFFGWRTGLKIEVRVLLTAVVFLVVTQVLAHGMTLPLRQMAAAARRMAAGEWDVAVTTTGRDEVGELARAFPSMAAQLAEVDRQRRALLADVSHELRTPLAALRARLENLVDGVEAPDPELLESMLRATERLGRLVSQLLASPVSRRAPRSSIGNPSTWPRSWRGRPTRPDSSARQLSWSSTSSPAVRPSATRSGSVRWCRTCWRTPSVTVPRRLPCD